MGSGLKAPEVVGSDVADPVTLDKSTENDYAGNFWKITYKKVMIAATLVFLASAIFHWPSLHVYSDITTSFWNRTNPSGVPYLTYEVPYLGYVFEYPPVCGLVVWIGGWLSHGDLYTYAGVEFAILGAFFIGTAHLLYKFLERLKLQQNLQLIFTLFVPSAFAFAAYNFDSIEVFFIVLTLYLFVKGRTNLSAVALGFAIATKLFPILMLPLFLLDTKHFKKKINFAIISLSIPAFLNLPFMIGNYSNWLAGYLYLKNFGLEDTFLIWLFPSRNLFATGEAVSGILIGASSCAVYFFMRKQSIVLRSFLVVGSFVLFSFMTPPQLNLDLLPFFALVPLVPIPLFYLFEAANVAFISLWDSFPNPSLPGFVQTIALAKQICLGLILLFVLFRRSYLHVDLSETRKRIFEFLSIK
jgi:uncharacterized membrane protein